VELFNCGIYCVADGRWYVSAVHGEEELDYLREHLPKALMSFAQKYAGKKRPL
jgi:hypothetical protein